MFVLAVNIHQVLARLAQLRQRRGVAVDEAARPASAIDRAAQDDSVRIAFKPGFTDIPPYRVIARKIKLGRQFGALRPLPHQRGVAASADQQLDRIDQDGFAGPRFAGEHAESGAGFELDALDDDEIPDAKRAQHQSSGLLPTALLQRNFSRSIVK